MAANVRVIVERVCARPDVLDACAGRDLGTVIAALKSGGIAHTTKPGLVIPTMEHEDRRNERGDA